MHENIDTYMTGENDYTSLPKTSYKFSIVLKKRSTKGSLQLKPGIVFPVFKNRLHVPWVHNYTKPTQR